MISCDSNDLANQAACLECLDDKSLMGVKTFLLCQYANSMGGTPPAAPTAIDATNCAPTSFTANWLASVGATSYRLDVSASPVFAGFVPGFNDLNVGNVLASNVTGLSPNTIYYYRVRAVNASGTSGNSGTINFTTAPNIPTNLLIDPTTTNGNIILNWTHSDAPSTNQIWRSIDGGSTYTLLASIAGATTTYTDAATLNPGDQYYYKVRGCNSSCCSAFTDPAGIFESLTKIVNTGTVIYSFPFLQFCIGLFFIGNEAALTTVSTPRLHTILGQYVIIANAVLTLVDVTNLVTCGAIAIANSLIVNQSFPALTATTSDFWSIRDNALMATVSAPLLVTVAGEVQIYNTPALTALSLPSLTSFGVATGSGWVATNSGIASLSIPACTLTGSSSFFCDSCPNLTSVSIPNLIFPDDSNTISFDLDILDAASVNSILARGVASGTTTCDYELNSPGNAAPTGQGVIDKGTLFVAGNTVNTN